VKLIYLLLSLLVFQPAGFSEKGISKKNIGPQDFIHEVVTLDGLSLAYTVSKKPDSILIAIRTEDPVMIARILALGLTLKFGKPVNDIKSINYPTGFLEIKNFSSSRELKNFWNYTSTPQIKRLRLERMFKHIIIDSIKEETLRRVDTIKHFETDLSIGRRSFNYVLTIPNNELKANTLEIKIGQLHIPPTLKRATPDHTRFQNFNENYMNSFRSAWVVKIRI
jgi:hypothetical protein